MTHSKIRKTFRTRLIRSVPVIGALIVFGTFMVNELLRDRMKKVADAIDQAQTRYDQWSYHRQDTENIYRVEERFISLRSQVAGETRSDWANSAATDADITMIGINTELAFLEPVVAAIPNGIHIFEQRRDKLNKDMAALSAPASKRVQDETGHEHQYAFADVSIENKDIAVSGEAQDFEEAVMRRGYTEKESAQKRYGRYQILSIVLYAFGWTLGLGAKLLGLDAGEQQEAP